MKIPSGCLVNMGRTYRFHSDDGGGKKPSRRSKGKGRKSRKNSSDYLYNTTEDTESKWDSYVEDRDPYFEKFSPKRKNKR